MLKQGGTNLIFSRKVFGWSKQCLWFEVGCSAVNEAIPDTILSGAMPSGQHKWNKNPEAFIKWMGAFTNEQDTIFDPFTGGGTVPAVCKMLGRNYLAFEIDATTADMARQRVANTQPPLFVPEPQQLAFEE